MIEMSMSLQQKNARLVGSRIRNTLYTRVQNLSYTVLLSTLQQKVFFDCKIAEYKYTEIQRIRDVMTCLKFTESFPAQKV